MKIGQNVCLNEILAKLKYISALVDKIIEVARHKAAPLSAIGDTVTAMRKTNPDKQNSGSGSTELDPNSPHHRRLQQLLLYMRCLHILSQTLDLSRAELKAKKLKPSTSVKNSKLLSYHIFGMRPSWCTFMIASFPRISEPWPRQRNEERSIDVVVFLDFTYSNRLGFIVVCIGSIGSHVMFVTLFTNLCKVR